MHSYTIALAFLFLLLSGRDVSMVNCKSIFLMNMEKTLKKGQTWIIILFSVSFSQQILKKMEKPPPQSISS